MKFPRGRGFEQIAELAALSLADYAGIDEEQVSDLCMAIRDACVSLAGRFFVGACQRVVVLIRAYPGVMKAFICGDGTRESGDESGIALDAHDSQMSLDVLRGLVDRVTMLEHQDYGICLSMTMRRRPYEC